MEVDRIQQIKGLRVERTGSEQERRRRPQTEEIFQELLEADLEDEEQPDQRRRQEREQTAKPADTVSITGGVPAAPLVNDLVSISTTARVSAEVRNAQHSVVENGKHASPDLPRPDDVDQSSKPAPVTEKPVDQLTAEPADADETSEPEEPASVDTLA